MMCQDILSKVNYDTVTSYYKKGSMPLVYLFWFWRQPIFTYKYGSQTEGLKSWHLWVEPQWRKVLGFLRSPIQHSPLCWGYTGWVKITHGVCGNPQWENPMEGPWGSGAGSCHLPKNRVVMRQKCRMCASVPTTLSCIVLEVLAPKWDTLFSRAQQGSHWIIISGCCLAFFESLIPRNQQKRREITFLAGVIDWSSEGNRAATSVRAGKNTYGIPDNSHQHLLILPYSIILLSNKRETW